MSSAERFNQGTQYAAQKNFRAAQSCFAEIATAAVGISPYSSLLLGLSAEQQWRMARAHSQYSRAAFIALCS